MPIQSPTPPPAPGYRLGVDDLISGFDLVLAIKAAARATGRTVDESGTALARARRHADALLGELGLGEPRRCPTCGEDLDLIERGSLGHVPGEPCDVPAPRDADAR